MAEVWGPRRVRFRCYHVQVAASWGRGPAGGVLCSCFELGTPPLHQGQTPGSRGGDSPQLEGQRPRAHRGEGPLGRQVAPRAGQGWAPKAPPGTPRPPRHMGQLGPCSPGPVAGVGALPPLKVAHPEPRWP